MKTTNLAKLKNRKGAQNGRSKKKELEHELKSENAALRAEMAALRADSENAALRAHTQNQDSQRLIEDLQRQFAAMRVNNTNNSSLE